MVMRSKVKSDLLATRVKTGKTINSLYFTSEKEIRTIPMSDVSSGNPIVKTQISAEPLSSNTHDVQSTSGLYNEVTKCKVSNKCKIKETTTIECESVHLCSAKRKLLEIAKNLTSQMPKDIPAIHGNVIKGKGLIINKKKELADKADDSDRKGVLPTEKDVHSINFIPDNLKHRDNSQIAEGKTTKFSENLAITHSDTFYPEKEEQEEEEYEIKNMKPRAKSDVYFINRPPKNKPQIISKIDDSGKNKIQKITDTFKAGLKPTPKRSSVGRKKVEKSKSNEDFTHITSMLGQNISSENEKPSTSSEGEQVILKRSVSIKNPDTYEEVSTKILGIDTTTILDVQTIKSPKSQFEDFENESMLITAEKVMKPETSVDPDSTTPLIEIIPSPLSLKLGTDDIPSMTEESLIVADIIPRNDEGSVKNYENEVIINKAIDYSGQVESLAKILSKSPQDIESSSNLVAKSSDNFYEALAKSTRITELTSPKESASNSLTKHLPGFKKIVSNVSVKDNFSVEQQSGSEKLQKFACREDIDSPCVKPKKGAKRRVIYLYDKDARFHDDGYTIEYLQKLALHKKSQ